MASDFSDENVRNRPFLQEGSPLFPTTRLRVLRFLLGRAGLRGLPTISSGFGPSHDNWRRAGTALSLWIRVVTGWILFRWAIGDPRVGFASLGLGDLTHSRLTALRAGLDDCTDSRRSSSDEMAVQNTTGDTVSRLRSTHDETPARTQKAPSAGKSNAKFDFKIYLFN